MICRDEFRIWQIRNKFKSHLYWISNAILQFWLSLYLLLWFLSERIQDSCVMKSQIIIHKQRIWFINIFDIRDFVFLFWLYLSMKLNFIITDCKGSYDWWADILNYCFSWPNSDDFFHILSIEVIRRYSETRIHILVFLICY